MSSKSDERTSGPTFDWFVSLFLMAVFIALYAFESMSTYVFVVVVVINDNNLLWSFGLQK